MSDETKSDSIGQIIAETFRSAADLIETTCGRHRPTMTVFDEECGVSFDYVGVQEDRINLVMNILRRAADQMEASR